MWSTKGWVAYKGKWYYTDKVTGERLYGWQKIGASCIIQI